MKKIVLILLITLIFLAIWELSAYYYSALKYFVSSPSTSINFAYENFTDLIKSTLITATEAISGLLIAIFFSFLVMLVCLYYPVVLKIILPIFVTSQVLPIITLAPLFIILFGMGIMSKIAMVVLMCFFPIFINFSFGVNSISNNIKEFLYCYNASKFFIIFRVVLPLSTPYIFTGIKLGTTMAMMGAIVAEFLGAIDGLGKNLYVAPKNSEAELMICSIFLIIFLGWFLFKSVELIEKKLGKWYLLN